MVIEVITTASLPQTREGRVIKPTMFEPGTDFVLLDRVNETRLDAIPSKDGETPAGQQGWILHY